MTLEPSVGVKVISSLPAEGTTKSVALYWSACACRPMMMGFSQPVTRRGMFLQMMASRKTVPPKMLRMVPLGDRHMNLSLNSSTRCSSGVIVAHLMPTLYFLMASAQSTVTWSSVLSRYSMPRSYLRMGGGWVR